MATRTKKSNAVDVVELPPPAKTREGRQNQLIDAAFALAEERIRNKEASAQEIVHFLKEGSTKAILEQEKLRQENEVLKSRVKEMESRKTGEELMQRALNAFRGYAGLEEIEESDYDGPPELY